MIDKYEEIKPLKKITKKYEIQWIEGTSNFSKLYAVVLFCFV